MKVLRICVLALCVCGLFGTATAATNGIPWRVGAYTLTARSMPVRQALETFAIAQGMPVIMSKLVLGVVSGNFENVPPTEFLDKVTTINNLMWYHDGATLYIYGASEALSTLIDLKYMKARELTGLLKQFGVEDPRYPIKAGKDGELIMVSGPPRYVQLVCELIARADNLREQRTFNEVEVRLFPLTYTWADSVSISVSTPESSLTIKGVAQILQEIARVDVNERAATGTNELSRADSMANRMGASVKPIIAPENRLNAVMIRDSVTRMGMYERIIKELDRPVKIVEVAITTIELTKKDALDWQLSLSVEGQNNSGKHSGGGGLNGSNLLTPDNAATRGLSGAYSYVSDNLSIGASISALQSDGKARGISRTALVTLNNFAASITDTQSYNTKVVGEKVANLQSVSAGTTFRVKPRAVKSAVTNVNHDVWMTFEVQDGGFEKAMVEAMPMTRNTTLTQVSMVREGQSLVVAGYLRDVDGEAGWGIPYLRDIPWIGWIFGGQSVTHETVQRMFVLTPRVVEYAASGTVEQQTIRLRETTEPERMAEAADRADEDRRLRRANEEEVRDIYKDKMDIKVERREAEIERDARERELDHEKKTDALEKDKKAWDKDFKARQNKYRDSKKND